MAVNVAKLGDLYPWSYVTRENWFSIAIGCIKAAKNSSIADQALGDKYEEDAFFKRYFILD